MQYPYRTLGGFVGTALPWPYDQRGDIKIMTLPVLLNRNAHFQSLLRHFDVLPPQRAISRFNHDIAGACMRRFEPYYGAVTLSICRTIQLQTYLIRAHALIGTAVLPAVTGPETLTAEQPAVRIFHFQPVRAPLHREIQNQRLVTIQVNLALLHHISVFAIAGAPAAVGRVAPIVITPLTYQAYLQPAGRL